MKSLRAFICVMVSGAIVFLTSCDSRDVRPKTNEVIREVPASIPEIYLTAMSLLQDVTNATPVGNSQVLFKMKDIRVVCILSGEAAEVISQDEETAKFELALRRNHVPINPASENVVQFAINGFWNESKSLFCYSVNCKVEGTVFVVRESQWHLARLAIWNKSGSFGTVGKLKAHESLLADVEKSAEIFANDFLSANPK